MKEKEQTGQGTEQQCQTTGDPCTNHWSRRLYTVAVAVAVKADMPPSLVHGPLPLPRAPHRFVRTRAQQLRRQHLSSLPSVLLTHLRISEDYTADSASPSAIKATAAPHPPISTENPALPKSITAPRLNLSLAALRPAPTRTIATGARSSLPRPFRVRVRLPPKA